MTIIAGRRAALQSFGLGLVAGAVGLATAGFGVAQAAVPPALTPTGAGQLNALMERLAKAPRRRGFKTVPMILTDPQQRDHEALSEGPGLQACDKAGLGQHRHRGPVAEPDAQRVECADLVLQAFGFP